MKVMALTMKWNQTRHRRPAVVNIIQVSDVDLSINRNDCEIFRWFS